MNSNKNYLRIALFMLSENHKKHQPYIIITSFNPFRRNYKWIITSVKAKAEKFYDITASLGTN